MSVIYRAPVQNARSTVGVATTDGILHSPSTGNKVKVVGFAIATDGAQTVTIESDDAAGDRILYRAYMAATTQVDVMAPVGCYLAETEAGADLLWTTSVATNAHITVLFVEEP